MLLMIIWNPRSPIKQLFKVISDNYSLKRTNILSFTMLCSISENVLGLIITTCAFFFDAVVFISARSSPSSLSLFDSTFLLSGPFLYLFLFSILNLLIIELILSLNSLPLKLNFYSV